MIIKKFQARTEREAVELAKKELGDGIVVMNAKEVRQKGLFSFMKSPVMEVTVALGEESERPPAIFAPQKETLAPIIPDSIWEKEESIRKESKREDAGKAIEEKLENLQSLLEERIKREEERPLREEEPAREPAYSKETMTFLKLLYNTMINNEVHDVYVNQIIEEVEKVFTPNVQLDFALSTVYQKLILKLGQPELITEGEKNPKVVFFIGPTGVGKTTTIAKIASGFSLEKKKKVALLTTDTYRIAAAEQLKTYANILEIPFRIVYAPDEMKGLIDEFRDFEYIFVDTTGHSHQNFEQREMTQEFLASIGEETPKEVYLVLSATTKYRDLTRIADSYSKFTEYKLIFTKLDETIAMGNLLNLKLYTGAALSYVAFGQNVPNDLQVFDPQSAVKQILSSMD